MSTTSRSGDNSGETLLSPSTAPLLKLVWTYKVGGPIEGPATVVNGTLYVGAWDGYEYALSASTGALLWKTYLSQVANPVYCGWMSPIGVTSGAAVSGNSLYVTSGATAYDLNAATGAITWSYVAGATGAGGTYLWASPLLYKGNVYIGVSSQCDNPLIRGRLVELNAGTGAVVHTFYTMTAGNTGASIWSSPALDTAANTIWLTTGNENTVDVYSRSVIAVNATTLTLIGYWKQPLAGYDYDFGAGATPAIGTSWLASTNKDGYTYGFNRTNVSTPGWSYIWKDQTTSFKPLTHPPADAISPAAWDGHQLYVGGGNTSVRNVTVPGSVRAINPANGAYIWQHASPGVVRGGIAYSNGLVVDNAVSKTVANQSVLEVLSSTNGALLWNYTIPWSDESNPTIAEGMIYVGTGSTGLTAWNTFPGGGAPGYVYAFAPYLAPPYNQGCNGNTTAQRLQWHTGAYGYSWNGPTYSGGYYQSLVTGTDWSQTPPPGVAQANITTVQYYMVGPHGAAGANTCYTPAASHTGVNANYTWTISWNAILYANCTGSQQVTANFALNLAGNVHIGSSPWYVAPGQSQTADAAAWSVTCGFWQMTGPPATITLNFAPFAVSGGTSYDFYTALWQSTFVQTSGVPASGASGYAAVTWQATFDYGGCSCP